MEYRVIWEIDVEAESYQEAAEAAAEMQKRGTLATVFDVYERLHGKTLAGGVRIDVSGETEPIAVALGVDRAAVG